MSVVRHVNQLIALNDVALVEALYETLLKRKADPDGLEFYVGQLRSGYEKGLMIAEFASSEEARPSLDLPGLRQYIDAQRRRGPSLWRRLTRDRQREVQMNRLENTIGQLLQELSAVRQELRNRCDALEDLLKPVDDVQRGAPAARDVALPPPAIPTAAAVAAGGKDDVDLSGVPMLAWRIYRELSAAVEAVDKPGTT
jgi:hypothetical protein